MMKPYVKTLGMSQADYETLMNAIDHGWAGLNREEIIKGYETGKFPRADKVKDLQKRFVWDFFWARVKPEIRHHLTANNAGDHINTALHRLMPKIQRRY